MKMHRATQPSRPSWWRRFCLWLLRAMGWTPVIAPLPGPRGVIIVYPHTSNWDFVIAVLYRFGTGLATNWMGKDSLFRWPFGGLLQRMGGVPVNRRAASGFIGAAVEQFGAQDWLWLALAPEGTRKHTDHLKSGFYQIAVRAGVPVGFGFIDYPSKTVGLEKFVRFSGDAEQDIALIREFYGDKRGKRPPAAGELRFRER
ncbi:1-acyl-sn-glycerol-3-phosphate acyltransferase [Thioalkalivibrio sp. XN8]|uniref:1-acyl-sn-glycerol-3-phosphate acyltransferase n=1 Tax=Thioalkalivibrio sp. XN8 TaxID=2712863 RepID=UPI001981FC0C|nr:1-acyl-sn-glycerol-3-phosphate acyltransferase [Thioalkalivibrio sp. XN8]